MSTITKAIDLKFHEMSEDEINKVIIAVKQAIRDEGMYLSEGNIYDQSKRVEIIYRFND